MRMVIKEELDIEKIVNLTPEQAKARYSIGRDNIKRIAEQAGAIIRIGRKILYNRKKLDAYFENHAE